MTIRLSRKYDDALLYLKHTSSITAFVESCLDNLKIDSEMMRSIKRVEYMEAMK